MDEGAATSASILLHESVVQAKKKLFPYKVTLALSPFTDVKTRDVIAKEKNELWKYWACCFATNDIGLGLINLGKMEIDGHRIDLTDKEIEKAISRYKTKDPTEFQSRIIKKVRIY